MYAYKYDIISNEYVLLSVQYRAVHTLELLMAKISCLEPLRVSSNVLSKHGVLFTKNITKLDILKIILNFLYIILLETFVILNIRYGIAVNDMALVNWMICIKIPILYYTAKMLTLLINRRYLLSILRDLNSEVFNGHTEELNRHVQKIRDISNLTLKYFALAVGIFLVVTCILPFVINIRIIMPAPFYTGGYDVFYKIPHLIAFTYFGLNAVSFDIFYMTLIGLAISQLNILQERLINVKENAVNIAANNNQENLTTITTRLLKECFIQHQMIIR